MDKFLNKYRIPSARLQTWDYGWNAPYFVTICTANRECFFGNIVDNEMKLSVIGELANQFWTEIPNHFPFVILDAFVVMPNHVHGILIFDKPDDRVIDKTNNGMGILGNDVPVNDIVGCDDIHGCDDITHRHNATGGDVSRCDDVTHFQNVIGFDDVPGCNDVPIETRQCLVSTINTTETINTATTITPPLTPGQKRFQNQGKNTLSSIIGAYKSMVTTNARQIIIRFGWQSRFHDHIIRDDASFHRIREYILNNPANWTNDTFFE